MPMKWPAAVYVLVGGILWMTPLLRILHVESSAVIAFVAFFVAGLTTLRQFDQGFSVGQAVIRQFLLLGIPLIMLTVSMIWEPNCEYGQGLLFFLLFPCITVVFATGLSFAIHASPLKRKSMWLVLMGVGISIAGPVYDIGFHPQFYTYNHVFGGVMGPIYDEEISVRFGLVVFRFLTFLWALLFWFVGMHFRNERGMLLRLSRAATVLGIGVLYLFSAPLRFNTPAWYIKQELGGHLATEHFDIYYAPEATRPHQLYQYRHDHEFRYAYLKNRLGIDTEDRIQSFIYPDPNTKERFTGARFTNVAPVWLRTPQMHIYADAFDQVFAHELVHVFSREFGLPVINASVSVGLVEGLAVALEPSEGRPLPHEQVLTSAVLADNTQGPGSANLAYRVVGSLSPFGFWTGRGAVSYTTMGSFVQFLIERYGVERIKRVYAFSNFEEVYGKSQQQLAEEWESYLADLPVIPRVTHDYVSRRFSVPSLFERRCPHHVPLPVVKHRESLQAIAEGDTVQAMEALDRVFSEEPMYQPAVETWAQIHLGSSKPDSVIERINRLYSREAERFRTPLLWLHIGDAYALTEQRESALAAYDRAKGGLPLYLHDQIGFVELRKAFVDTPEILEIITGPLAYSDKVVQLQRIEEDRALLLFFISILHSAGDNIEAAREALELVDIESISKDFVDIDAIKRYYRIKKSMVYYQSEDPLKALDEAVALERELAFIGAIPEAAFYTDFANKMRYISRAQ